MAPSKLSFPRDYAELYLHCRSSQMKGMTVQIAYIYGG